jgi:hypothetical protein
MLITIQTDVCWCCQYGRQICIAVHLLEISETFRKLTLCILFCTVLSYTYGVRTLLYYHTLTVCILYCTVLSYTYGVHTLLYYRTLTVCLLYCTVLYWTIINLRCAYCTVMYYHTLTVCILYCTIRHLCAFVGFDNKCKFSMNGYGSFKILTMPADTC